MKDYTLDQNSKKKYIVDMFVAENKTITIIFADGTRFENIAYTDDNLDLIAKVQEGQAKVAVNKLPIFRRKASNADLGMCAATGAAFIVGGCLSCFTSVCHSPAESVALVGTVTLCGFIPSFIHAIHEKEKLKELEKIKYRDDHRDELDSYKELPNSLAGVKNRRHFAFCRSHEEDPFSILAIDCFSKKDLETIVDNVERENEFGFTYQKRVTR